MHEGHHGILDESNKELEKKFGCTDCGHMHDHDHNHDHDDHGHDHDQDHHHGHNRAKSGKTLEIVAGIIIGALVLFFLYWKFFR